jgi:hypothetical protein
MDPDSDPDPAPDLGIFDSDLQDDNFFLLISTSYYWIRIRIQEAKKHTDPAEPAPDPQHRIIQFKRTLDEAMKVMRRKWKP